MVGIQLGVDRGGVIRTGDKVYVGIVPKDWRSAPSSRTDPKWLTRIFMVSYGIVAAKILIELAAKTA